MARLHAACFTLPPPWSAQELEATREGRFSFTLERPGGFLMAQVVAGEAELLTLAVDPSARRQGIGRSLVQGFLDEARARGADLAVLEVAESNEAARALYAGMGFVETGRRRGYYRSAGRVEDAILMGLSI